MSRVRRTAGRVYFWLAIGLLLMVLVAAGGLALVFTETGSRWVVDWARPLLPAELSFAGFQGALAGPLEWTGLEYEQGGLRVRVEKVQVTWRPLSLWNAEIELDSVDVTGALVTWTRDTSAVGEEPPDSVAAETEPTADWKLKWRTLVVTGAVVEGPNDITLHDISLWARGELDGYECRVTSALSLDTLSGLRLACSGSGDLSGFKADSLEVALDSARVRLRGEVSWKPAVAWQVALQAEGIDPSAWWPTLSKLPGSVQFGGESSGRVDSAGTDFSVRLDTLAGTLRGSPVWGRAAVRLRQGRLEIDSSRVEWSGFKAYVQGVYADSVDLVWDIAVPDLSVLDSRLSGSAAAKGKAHGPADSLDVEAAVEGRQLGYGAYTADSLAGRLTWGHGGRELSTLGLRVYRVVLSGWTPDSVHIDGRGTLDSHGFTIASAGPRGHLNARFEGAYDSLWHGTLSSLTVDTKRIGRWGLVAPAHIEAGPARYSLAGFCLRQDSSEVCASGGWRSDRDWELEVALADFPASTVSFLFPPEFNAAALVNAHVAMLSSPDTGMHVASRIALSPGRLTWGAELADTLNLDSTYLELAGHPAGTALNIKGGLDGSTRYSLALDVSGIDQLVSLLQSDSVAWTTVPWSVRLSVEPLSLTWIEEYLPADVRPNGVASALLEAACDAQGVIQGDCTVRLPAGELLLFREQDTLAVNWSASRLEAHADSARVAATVASTFSTSEAQVGLLDLELRSPEPLRLPVRLGELPLEGHVRCEFDLSALQPLVAKLSGLRGRMDVNTSVQGTPRDLHLNGQLQLSAEAFVRDLGIQLSNITLSMLGAGDSVTVTGGAQSGEGRLELSGHLDRVPSRTRPSRLRIRGERFLALESREASIWLSPDLELVLAGDSVDVSGTIVVPRARIEITKLPEQAVALSPDVVILGDSAATRQTRVPTWAEVQVVLGDDVFFKGFDITSYLNGALETKYQPGSDIEGRGEVVLREGRYRGYGQDLQVDPGRLVFTGPLDNPGLDVVAYRRASDQTKAGFKITGTVQNPKIDLYSEPHRPDRDIMSYIMFGRPASEGSESDRMKASQAAALMGGNLLAAQAATQLGLDEARIDPGTTGNDAALVAGVYVSPQLFVGYGTGLFETLHTLRVRYIVSKHISLQAETGTRETADILYQIERGD